MIIYPNRFVKNVIEHATLYRKLTRLTLIISTNSLSFAMDSRDPASLLPN